MLFKDAASAYIEAKRTKVRANTLACYESAIRCHLLPRWSGIELGAIRQEDIQAWVSGMSCRDVAEDPAFSTLEPW